MILTAFFCAPSWKVFTRPLPLAAGNVDSGKVTVSGYRAAYSGLVSTNAITEEFIKPEDSYDYDESDDSDAVGGNNSPGYHSVKAYTRTNPDGSSTHVDGYFRSNPDGNKSNNLSSPN